MILESALAAADSFLHSGDLLLANEKSRACLDKANASFKP